MPIAAQYSEPSTLTGVFRQIQQAFDLMGDATPLMFGAHYLREFGAGSPPRILFVPETDGQLGPPLEMGNVCSFTHGCQVLLRATEEGDDLERFDRAYDLARRVLTCIRVAGTGRVALGSVGDGSPVDVNAYGAELAFGFSYVQDIAYDPERMKLAAAPADTSAERPLIPPGDSGQVDSTTIAVTPTA